MKLYGLAITAFVTWAMFHSLGIGLDAIWRAIIANI